MCLVNDAQHSRELPHPLGWSCLPAEPQVGCLPPSPGSLRWPAPATQLRIRSSKEIVKATKEKSSKTEVEGVVVTDILTTSNTNLSTDTCTCLWRASITTKSIYKPLCISSCKNCTHAHADKQQAKQENPRGSTEDQQNHLHRHHTSDGDSA